MTKTRKRRRPGRHQFTQEERARGWATTMQRYPHLGLWLLQRCRDTSPQRAYPRCGKYY